MTQRVYVLLILAVMFGMALLFAVLSFTIYPFAGDLTRMGGFLEHKFAWSKPQQGFSFTGTTYAKQFIRQYKPIPQMQSPYYVIIGDSFSHWCEANMRSSRKEMQLDSPCSQWTAFIKNETGIDSLTFHIEEMRLEQIFSELKKQQQKPEFIIYETGERRAALRLHQQAAGFNCATDSEKVAINGFRIAPQNREMISYTHDAEPIPWDFNSPVALIRQNFKQLSEPAVLSAGLSSDALFSSENSATLLYFEEDLHKRDYTEAHYDLMACGMRAVQQRVTTALGVPVLFTIFPDKSAVYAPWVADQANRIDSIIPRVPVTDDLYWIDVFTPLQNAVEQGVVDVYLPNDTHWGSEGNRIVAEAVVGWLDRAGALTPAR